MIGFGTVFFWPTLPQCTAERSMFIVDAASEEVGIAVPAGRLRGGLLLGVRRGMRPGFPA